MIRDILVKVESDQLNDPALDYSVTVAEAFDAHLACIAFGDLVNMPAFMMPGLPGYNSQATLPKFDPEGAKIFEKFLDSPHRVIIETEANLVVSFDVAKFNEFTARAIAAGLGVE